MQLIIILGALALLFFYLVSIYNRLVRLRTMVSEGWSGIDVQLKKRHDLIPNLLESVKGYKNFEQETLQKVIAARNAAMGAKDVASHAAAEGQLQRAMGGFFALAEQYPDLKASANFIQLQDSLKEIETSIEQSRRYYNGTVRELNTLVDSFPSNLVANQFQFQKATFFELENTSDRDVPKISF
ncbi:MAG TPA: LemA family protein [Saprospiraceae bacterium]|jgi:LemA protein|nr:LemA family protein [Saprospiraceae bacterium]MCC6689475.1 LemA family protein [Saprospiraceae bacterium]HMV24794.1 LemA family protein [Saprospiraceae bacterium]HMX85552.1 LemA family protein [Saprospiraceae bacterium]HMZ72231.1 LemA family protein [Saprospiraceae bacterium]